VEVRVGDKLVVIGAVALFLAFGVSGPAVAQLVGTDTAPGSSCAGIAEGATRLTADADLDGASVVLVCDGTTWNTQGVKVHYDAAACDSGKGGTIRYNSGGTPEWEYCDGGADTWRPFEHAAGGDATSCFETWTQRDSVRNWGWHSVASSADGIMLVAGVGDVDASATGHIYTSTDSGATWTQRDSNRIWSGVASSANGQNLVAVVYGGRIYTSTDAGVTWTQRASNQDWTGVASSANGQNLAATTWAGQIYTSTNAGVSWTARATARNWTDITSSADGQNLAATDWTSERVYTSTNAGVSWTARPVQGALGAIGGSADGMSLVTYENWTGVGYIEISTDGGATWTSSLHAPDELADIVMSDDGMTIVAVGGGDGGPGRIFISKDGGASWNIGGDVRAWRGAAVSSDGSQILASAYNGYLYTSSCEAIPDCSDDTTAECVLQSTRADGDPQFTAANIANGVNILGITGTMGSACPSNGVQVGGHCWYSGGATQTCTQVCTLRGLTYSNATRDYAGSAGSASHANCGAVLNALFLPGSGNSVNDPDCEEGIGCNIFVYEGVTHRYRCTSEVTNAGNGGYYTQRVCACQ